MKQLTEAQLTRMVIALVAGRQPWATTPRVVAMVESLRRDLAALPPGAIIVIPSPLP